MKLVVLPRILLFISLGLIYDRLISKVKNRLVNSIISRGNNLLARRRLNKTRTLISLSFIPLLLISNKRLST